MKDLDESDYWYKLYAGLAMCGMLAHSTRYRPRSGDPESWHEAISEEAHEIAGAMIRAEKK